MYKLIYLVSFVLISFLVGLEIGVSKGGPPAAYAKNYSAPAELMTVFPAPELNLTPIGAGGEVNSKASVVFSFTSESSVEDLISSQEKRWKEVGLTTSVKETPQRGVLLGINRADRELFQIVAFFCPPAVREKLCSGQNTFGMVSRLTQESSAKANVLPFTICAGGKEISSYSASDMGHPSVTSTILCPSSIESVQTDLDSEFLMWNKKEETGGILIYSRDGDEVTIIPSGKDEKTLLVVTYQRGVS